MTSLYFLRHLFCVLLFAHLTCTTSLPAPHDGVTTKKDERTAARERAEPLTDGEVPLTLVTAYYPKDTTMNHTLAFPTSA